MSTASWLSLVVAAFLAASITPVPAQTEARGKGRLEPTTCWFEASVGWPRHECHYFHVPENHDDPSGREIAVPVLVFRSFAPVDGRAPVLHLGGGGPGAPVYLDYTAGAYSLWANHDEISLNQGRDLYIIDPRGTGVARPLLTCQTYVDNVLDRWRRNLSLEQEWREADEDYFDCFDQLREEVDFAAYNSLTIARDVEWLRNTIGAERWVLIGVSYASVYAQTIVKEYPGSVESMILDSTAFPNVHADHDFLTDTMAPYEALLNYCEADPTCDEPIEDLEERLWQLVDDLDRNPLPTPVTHPYEGVSIAVLLNGHRLVETLINGVYDEEIFQKLPVIIRDLEQRRSTSLTPFIEDYLSYLLDRTFGDVSASSHYCYETKPFTDIDRMREAAKRLPAGYIRDTALLAVDWPDFCEALAVGPGEARLGLPVETDIPTLFLHGELDPVTRLEDVRAQSPQFSNGVVITFPLSHDVLSSAQCAEVIAAKFVDSPWLEKSALTCR